MISQDVASRVRDLRIKADSLDSYVEKAAPNKDVTVTLQRQALEARLLAKKLELYNRD